MRKNIKVNSLYIGMEQMMLELKLQAEPIFIL